RDGVDGHEANIVAIALILAARIAQAHNELHLNPLNTKEATRRPPQLYIAERLADHSASVSPASADLRPDGATMVAMVKSRSVITGVMFFGSFTDEICSESPISVSVRSTTVASGIALAGADTS